MLRCTQNIQEYTQEINNNGCLSIGERGTRRQKRDLIFTVHPFVLFYLPCAYITYFLINKL